MNEFKGTKGKWEIYGNSQSEFEFYSNEKPLFDILPGAYNEENKYNALLISKAPEMLEMLKTIDQALDELWQKDDKNVLFDYLSGIDTKQLIKEATEI